MKRAKSNKSLKSTASVEDLPPAKRVKRKISNDSDNGDDEEEVGSWLPKTKNWEGMVDRVETIERDSSSNQLMAYLHFKNGKRTKVSMDQVYQNCPRPMLKFYEEHLKFC
jgi:chromobox protein 1